MRLLRRLMAAAPLSRRRRSGRSRRRARKHAHGRRRRGGGGRGSGGSGAAAATDGAEGLRRRHPSVLYACTRILPVPPLRALAPAGGGLRPLPLPAAVPGAARTLPLRRLLLRLLRRRAPTRLLPPLPGCLGAPLPRRRRSSARLRRDTSVASGVSSQDIDQSRRAQLVTHQDPADTGAQEQTFTRVSRTWRSLRFSAAFCLRNSISGVSITAGFPPARGAEESGLG